MLKNKPQLYSSKIANTKQNHEKHILFKHKDNVISGLIGSVELNQVGMVELVHNLNLTLYHLLLNKSYKPINFTAGFFEALNQIITAFAKKICCFVLSLPFLFDFFLWLFLPPKWVQTNFQCIYVPDRIDLCKKIRIAVNDNTMFLKSPYSVLVSMHNTDRTS